jgi:AcrR family transcriptional regulator
MADQSCDTNRPHNRRDLILDTAQVLFARDGYGSTGIRAIAAEVGISEATIYHYFRSKDEILDGIINRTAEGQLQVYRFPAEMCLKEVLYNVGTMFLKVMEASENRDLIQLLLTESAHDQRRAELYLSRIWDQGLQALEVAIAERLPGRPTITAATIAKMLLGSLTCFVVHNETLAAVAGRPLENELDPGRWEYLDQVIGILLYGIEGGNASAPNV